MKYTRTKTWVHRSVGSKNTVESGWQTDTDRRTDRPTDGRTIPIALRSAITMSVVWSEQQQQPAAPQHQQLTPGGCAELEPGADSSNTSYDSAPTLPTAVLPRRGRRQAVYDPKVWETRQQRNMCMLYNCLEWYKWVWTNLYNERQLYNTLFPSSPAVGLRISRLSGSVELTLRYTTPDIQCRHRRHECDDGIMLAAKRPIGTGNVVICPSVRLSVCWSRPCALQIRPTRPRCRLG